MKDWRHDYVLCAHVAAMPEDAEGLKHTGFRVCCMECYERGFLWNEHIITSENDKGLTIGTWLYGQRPPTISNYQMAVLRKQQAVGYGAEVLPSGWYVGWMFDGSTPWPNKHTPRFRTAEEATKAAKALCAKQARKYPGAPIAVVME